MSICSGIALPCLVPTSTIPGPCPLTPNWSIRNADALVTGFEERVAACTATARYRASCTCPSGRRRRLGAFGHSADGRDHLHPSRPWPLPREGSGPARDVRRADGQGAGHESWARGLDAHRRPVDRHLRCRTGSWVPDCRSRRAPRTAAQLDATAASSVAFFGDGAVAHGTFHEAINLAAVWRLPAIFFCENNGYAESHPRPPARAPLERRAAGYGVDYIAVDGNDVVATAAAMSSAVEAARAGRGPVVVEAADVPLARSLRGRPGALPITRRGSGVGGARPAAPQRAAAPIGGHHRRGARIHAVVGRARARPSRRGRSTSADTGGRHADGLRRPPETGTRRATGPGRRCARCSAPWTAIRAALEAELAGDERVFVAGIDVAAGNVFGVLRGLHDRFGDRVARHPHLRERDHRPRRRRGDGGHAPGRRVDVPRLRRRLPRPAAQPGREAAVHDRRHRADGADRSDPVRRGALLGKPALAEPRGTARAHPRVERRHAVDSGRHVRVAARRRSRTRTRSCSSRTGCSTA